jgi:predicted AAA+ superfamily ATPase
LGVVDRFFEIPDQSFFLLGPRGTGKSTWLRHRLGGALYLDLLDPALHRQLRARPERLRELLAGAPGRHTVVVDEVQRIPELLTVVHAILEEPSPPRFVLTGSSARKLRRGSVDLLGGRALQRTLHPFMASEVPQFALPEALEFGMLPLTRAATRPGDVLDAYAALYVDQEVQAEGLTRNIGAFGRFLEATSFSHAMQLNISAIARECQVERNVVSNYVGILEDLLLAFRLPVFRKRAKRATVVHDKLYLFDAGVFRALRPRGPLDRAEEIEGQALEGLVAQHLRAWVAYSERPASLYYWRTRGGSEVDFVVYGEDGVQAFEVKRAGTVHPSDLRGLRAFRDDYPEAEAAILYGGQQRLRIDGIWCLPIEEFLRRMVPNQSLLGWL